VSVRPSSCVFSRRARERERIKEGGGGGGGGSSCSISDPPSLPLFSIPRAKRVRSKTTLYVHTTTHLHCLLARIGNNLLGWKIGPLAAVKNQLTIDEFELQCSSCSNSYFLLRPWKSKASINCHGCCSSKSLWVADRFSSQRPFVLAADRRQKGEKEGESHYFCGVGEIGLLTLTDRIGGL
jgi:hypothetical protein